VAGVHRLQLGQFLGVGLDGVGQAQQQPPPLAGRRPAPGRERRRRGRDRPVDVGRPGLGHLGQLRQVVWVQDLEGRALDRVDELPADEELVLHPCASTVSARADGVVGPGDGTGSGYRSTG
jgi:hypothetical protein